MQWFKHDTDATLDGKLRKVLLRYGTDGYAIYFHCLELIAGNISDTNITFELEHDSEVIADNLKVKSYRQDQTAIERVEEIMRFIVDEKLFEYSDGRITCFKLLKRLDSSMTSNQKMRDIITSAKKNHDTVMISHDTVMQEENRIDKNRQEENKEEAPDKPAKRASFQKPSLDDVKAYCLERKNKVDPNKFMAYYESNGWKVGRNSMKDWRAAVRTWEGNGYDQKPGYSKPLPVQTRTTFLDMED